MAKYKVVDYSLFVIVSLNPIQVLYENIDQILSSKLHGPMHYKITLHALHVHIYSVVIT